MTDRALQDRVNQLEDDVEALHQRIDALTLALGKLAKVSNQLPIPDHADRHTFAEIADLVSDVLVEQGRREGMG